MSLLAVQFSVIDCQHSSGIAAAAKGGDGITAIAVAAAAQELTPASRHFAAEVVCSGVQRWRIWSESTTVESGNMTRSVARLMWRRCPRSISIAMARDLSVAAGVR